MTSKVSMIIGAAVGLSLLAGCATNPKPGSVDDQTITDMMATAHSYVAYEAGLEYIESPLEISTNISLAMMMASNGREDLIAAARSSENYKPAPCFSLPEEPLPVLTEKARETNIVVINEDFRRPSDRLFILELIKTLRAEGYTHYAYKELLNADSARFEGKTSFADGAFTAEPVFARVLEEIRGSGLTVVSYAPKPDQKAPDDADPYIAAVADADAEVANLIENVFSKNPDTRIIIHVPFRDVDETVRNEDAEWMTARLKKATGIDPLTITQDFCQSTDDRAVLTTSTDQVVTFKLTKTDYAVGHPKLTFTNGRPDYRRAMGDKEVTVPSSLLPTDKPVLLEARPVGASQGVVPTDRLFLMPGETLPLMLPPGAYTVTGYVGGEKEPDPVEIRVE